MIYFMRHGDVFTNSNNKKMSVAEASQKISLSELGKKQIRNVVLPKNLDIIVISDSRRTKETAEILLESNNISIPVQVEAELHPWNSGADDWNTYWKRYCDFITHYNNESSYESKDSMKKRVSSVISKYSNRNVLIIAHSILLATYLGENFLHCAELIPVQR